MLNFTEVKALKPFFTLLMLTAFLGSTMGVNVYKHYCGELLEGISLYIQTNPCAEEGGEDACSANNEDECCDDEFNFYQLDLDFIQSNSSKIKMVLSKVAILRIEKIQFSPILESKKLKIEGIPPPMRKIPIYKLNQKLVFYV